MEKKWARVVQRMKHTTRRLLWDPYHVVRPGILDDGKATENRIKNFNLYEYDRYNLCELRTWNRPFSKLLSGYE